LLFLLLFSFSEVCTRFGKMVNGLIFTWDGSPYNISLRHWSKSLAQTKLIR
jgi:hypothetical protein